jgi:predicted nucleotidyltransferase
LTRLLTPYPEANAFVDALRDGIEGALAHEITGIYVTGSIAWGGFDPAISDVDLLVATVEHLSADRIDALRVMHEGLREHTPPLSHRVDVLYLPPSALRPSGGAHPVHPVLDSHRFEIEPHWSDHAFSRHIARERGIALYGPPPADVIGPVSPDELRASARDQLRHGWRRNLEPEQQEWLSHRHRQAFATLTMCRALHTLATGDLLSKPDAAAWALSTLDRRWHPLIERALPWRYDRTPDDTSEVKAFIRWILEQAGINHS